MLSVPSATDVATAPVVESEVNTAGFLSVSEVADALRVGRSTIYRLIGSGSLAAYKVGSQYRVDPVDLARAITPTPARAPRARRRRRR